MLLACVALVVAGCSAGDSIDRLEPGPPVLSEDASEYEFDESAFGDYVFVWSAVPDLDLLSREAALARAVEEARNISLFVGDEVSFPGYAQMLRNSGEGVSAHGRADNTWRSFGVFYAKLLSITPVGDGFRAEYCRDTRSVDASYNAGGWRTPLGPVSWWAVEFEPVAQSAFEVLPEPSGRRVPNYDVFAGWRMTKPVESEIAHQRCVDWQWELYPDAQVDPFQPGPASRSGWFEIGELPQPVPGW
ncbi:hypothetical protein GCM10011410_29160 [Hoyosella rhizosphaerae]|uniref:Uncharacterized protein n=1 Tax=Hoyosella rhizosphaerae TaxID=1755582 RepID=A0A916UIP3_9ACTN|nr:hypothetical protein GCM10011410_29160 [Hoyosella rhizosphaerae]